MNDALMVWNDDYCMCTRIFRNVEEAFSLCSVVNNRDVSCVLIISFLFRINLTGARASVTPHNRTFRKLGFKQTLLLIDL